MFEIGGKKIPGTLAEIVDPARSALLIWDMEYAIGPNAFNYKEIPHGREIVEELKPQPQDMVFQKRRPDGFVGTDFDLMLRSRNVKTILIGGVATEGGVEGSARSARNLGYDVVVVRDCVGSRNRELHDMALKLMEQTHFDIATAGDIADIWREK